MEFVCSMIECYNSSNSVEPKHFYRFPTNFDLCILWVQNCGKAEYFEDFAYGGAQPFMNRYVCSDHFNGTDFIDAHHINRGLKLGAVPIPNCAEQDSVTIKQEVEDLEETFDSSVSELMYSENVAIKQETIEDDGTTIYLENGLRKPEEQALQSDLSKEKALFTGRFSNTSWKSQNAFRTAWKRALDTAEQREVRNRANALRNAFRRANETEEQRKARNEANALRNASRRACETEEQRKERLYKNAVRAALRRSMESEEEQRERRRKNALRAAFRRNAETEEQRAERRLKDKLRSAERRKRETDLQSKIRRYNDAVRAAFRRSNETDEQKHRRRMYDVMRAARRRSNENDDQRRKRLQADRERAAKRRMLNKFAHSITSINDTFFDHDLGPYLDNNIPLGTGTSNNELSFEHELNDSSEDPGSIDDFSNHSEYTNSECDSGGNTSIGEFSENYGFNSTNNNSSDVYNNVTDFNDIAALASDNSINSFTNFTPEIEVKPPIISGEQSVGVVTLPEVVWCT